MKIKKGEFIEVDFVGRIKDTNEIFDLTKEDTAKENNIYNSDFQYKPVIICVGEGHLLKGLDEKLIGKEEGKHKIELKTEEAFGKKDLKLLRLVPVNIFRKENLKPFPGLNVNIDGIIGTIRSVSGGRVIVDFNHPLAGKDLFFDLEIKRIVKDDKEKVESLVSKLSKEFEVNIKEKKAEVKVKLGEKEKEFLKEKITKLIPNIKNVDFT
ncbi:peptidylprolyl isomerase [Candidatus Woesearchaeota archaeon]|nr:peptidylprolyl isomerase [Candidatus Woesearchaeota archaeon]